MLVTLDMLVCRISYILRFDSSCGFLYFGRTASFCFYSVLGDLLRVSYGVVWFYLLYDSFFFFKQKTAYDMRISDWSSDGCSSDLPPPPRRPAPASAPRRPACMPRTAPAAPAAVRTSSRGPVHAVDERRQRRIEGDAVVEDEAAAVVALAADLFEVAEDAAVELQHVVHAVRAQPQRGLFAADAARAEAHHGGVGQRLAMRRQGLGQLGEIVDRQRQRTRERAVRDLLAIARVEQHDALAGIVVALFDPARQVRRRNRRRASAQRRGVVAAEAEIGRAHV